MQNRRFIAGAVCPRCALMDRIVMYSAEEGQFRECVSCGFKEKLVEDQQPAELTTRVNQERKPQAAATPLRFFPNPYRKG